MVLDATRSAEGRQGPVTERAEQREQVTAIIADTFGQAAVAGAEIESITSVGRVRLRDGRRAPETLWEAPRWMQRSIGEAPLGVCQGARSSPPMPPRLFARVEARLRTASGPRPRVEVQLDEVAIVRLRGGRLFLLALGAGAVVARVRRVQAATCALRVGLVVSVLAGAASVGALVGWGAPIALFVVAAALALARALGPGSTEVLPEW